MTIMIQFMRYHGTVLLRLDSIEHWSQISYEDLSINETSARSEESVMLFLEK